MSTETTWPSAPGLHRVERALDLRIVEQRVVDARGEALLPSRARPIFERLGLVLGDRLLDQHVAAALERGDRDLRVRRRRREHVDHVRARLDQLRRAMSYAVVPHFSAFACARFAIEIGDADELDIGESLHRCDVELTDVACADHAGAKRASS